MKKLILFLLLAQGALGQSIFSVGTPTITLKKFASTASTPNRGLKLYASSSNNTLVTVDSTGAVKNIPTLEDENIFSKNIILSASATGTSDRSITHYQNRLVVAGGSTGLQLASNFSGANGLITVDNGLLTFSTNGSERMRVHSNGSVGINTITNAGYTFDVNGMSRFTGDLTIAGNILASGTRNIGSSGVGFYGVYSSQFFADYILPRSSFGISFQNTSGVDILKMFNSTNNVAIGTTTNVPSAVLQVASTSQGSIPFPRLTTSQRDTNITTPVDGLFIYNTTDHVVQFWNGSVWKTITTN